MKTVEKADEQLLSIKELAYLFGYSEAHTKRHIITQEEFPKPVRLVDKGVPRWLKSEILRFIESRKEV